MFVVRKLFQFYYIFIILFELCDFAKIESNLESLHNEKRNSIENGKQNVMKADTTSKTSGDGIKI